MEVVSPMLREKIVTKHWKAPFEDKDNLYKPHQNELFIFSIVNFNEYFFHIKQFFLDSYISFFN